KITANRDISIPPYGDIWGILSRFPAASQDEPSIHIRLETRCRKDSNAPLFEGDIMPSRFDGMNVEGTTS
ncbi:MAG: hypothetical protein JW959_04005, partial [Pirellulales bacterium]|nr:hypothetical protein [Pirellulales bacterium]